MAAVVPAAAPRHLRRSDSRRGDGAEISICAFHGCTASSVTLETVALGVGARGRYRVEANAGPLYEDEFEATWVGTPWEVRDCDYEMNPP